MISLLAPTRVEGVDDGDTFIIECSQDVFLALKAAVEIAYSSPMDVPIDYVAAGTQAYRFFVEGQVTDDKEETT
jgi:hypothetical protein